MSINAPRISPTDDAGDWQIGQIVSGLRALREQWRESQLRNPDVGRRELPSRETLRKILESLAGVLFPMRLGPVDLRQETEDFYIGHTLDTTLSSLLGEVRLELGYAHRRSQSLVQDQALEAQARQIVTAFAQSLPDIRAVLDSDVLAAFSGDPAARSVDEVLLCYPGVLAMVHYRLAHRLYALGVPLIARIISELAHGQTGIDIHPGAAIGHSFFIDHGTGVVIGETAVIGNHVRLYQAVTLGAKRFPVDDQGNLQKGQARHPIVEDHVVIYAGATILGRITIGHHSVIGGNVWLTRSVPPHSNVSQAGLQHHVPAADVDPKDQALL